MRRAQTVEDMLPALAFHRRYLVRRNPQEVRAGNRRLAKMWREYKEANMPTDIRGNGVHGGGGNVGLDHSGVDTG